MSVSNPSLAIPPVSFAIQRYFEVALYLLVLTGFGTLASTGGLDVFTVVLVGAALLFRGYLLATRRSFTIPERWTNLLTLLYVAFYLVDYFLISGAFLYTTVHLVLFVMVVRLFSARRDRDFYLLAVISFVMVLAAAILTVDSVFLLAFAGFMLMAVGTFILMEMRRTSAKATVHSRESSDTSASRRMAWSLAGVAPLLMVLILLGAIAIFFILPRISAGYLSSYAPSGELTTGFSDRVRLGSIGEIQQSRSVVMHIQIDGDQTGGFDLKWRGVTLSAFDGRTWSNPREKFAIHPRADGSFALAQPDAAPLPNPAARSVRPIHYRVLMEPVGASVFFLAATPRLLQGSYRLIAMDSGGAVFDLDPERPVNRYEASSLIPQPNVSDLRAAAGAYPPEVLSNYLPLPELDPRIPSLAQQITASADNNYDKAVAVESYLRTRFGYTLQLPRVLPRDPLANFLFERRQGHCEYFASSMAVMLRTLRIPSRVVNGFRTGEFNDLTSQYLVRASNAHSWVEAYFPPFGWYEFDPTPPDPLHSRPAFARLLGNLMDAVDLWWWEDIVNYDFWKQYQLIGTLRMKTADYHRRLKTLLAGVWQKGRFGIEEIRGSGSAFRPAVPAAVALVFGLSATFFILWRRAGFKERLLRLMRKFLARSTEAGEVSSFYAEALDLLRSRGFKRDPCDTALEFARSLGTHPVAEPFEALTVLYNRVRFGRPGAESDTDQAEALLEVLRTSIRQT